MELEKKSPLPNSSSEQKTVRKPLQPIARISASTGDKGRSSHRFNSEEEAEEDESDLPVRSTRRTRPAPITLSSDDSSQPDTTRKPATPTRRFRLFQGNTVSSPSDSDGESPTTKIHQKLSISPRSTRASHSGTTTEARPSEAQRANKISKPVVISDGSEDTSSEDVVATPVRRRKTMAHVQSPCRTIGHVEESESSDDLQEELDDLQEIGTPLRSTRTRNGPVVSERSKRQQKLEELKRRRAGIRDESQEEDEQNEWDENDENDEADSSGPEPIHHAMRRGSNLDEYENDFLDDEDDKVGVDLGVAGVPLEFTYHANKKPFEHFKTEIEWMVHNKLNPAFDRHDEMYQLAYKKLDKEVEAFVGSKFSSSVWGEDFRKALQARPDLDRLDVPTMLEHKCDACRRTNHPPKHKITLSGKPYNRNTLEIIERDEDEDEDEDTEGSDDDESSSAQGETFFLGRFGLLCQLNLSLLLTLSRFCCANAEMAHALHHWRYALNQTVLAWLAAEGYLAPTKIVEREKLSQKKRQKATNKIVDGMEDRGVMKLLYKQFKENLAAARDAKVSLSSRDSLQIFSTDVQQPERFSNGH